MEHLRFLLNDESVRQEIDRYKWIESEKMGYDIGFENAAQSWLFLYGDDWIKARLGLFNDDSKTGIVIKRSHARRKLKYAA